MLIYSFKYSLNVPHSALKMSLILRFKCASFGVSNVPHSREQLKKNYPSHCSKTIKKL